MAKVQIGQCALCGNQKELQLSHIIPNFVGRKLIKTSPGNIRSADEPNKVRQDIEKHFMLCHECEELFSGKERWFSANLFNPYQDANEKSFNYDENLTYFIISLSWRSLYLDLKEFLADPSFDQNVLSILLNAEQVMRDYLLGKRSDVETIENHIFFMDRIHSANNLEAAMNPSVAIHRSISSYTVYNGKTLFTVSNLMGILIVTFYSMESNENWINTKITLGSGNIHAQNQEMTSVVGQEIQYWMNQAEAAKNNLSDIQRNKIQRKLKDLGDDIKKYAIFQDWMDDASLK